MERTWPWVLWLLVALPALAGSPAGAQEILLTLDNDLFAPRGAGPPPDRDYTGGLRLTITHPSGMALSAVQEVYTPRRDSLAPVPGERPYAAWLYAELGWSVPATSARVRELGLAAGVLGPAALGEQVQNGVHHLTGSEAQEGWAHQLRIGPTVQLRYREGVRVGGAAGWSLAPFAEILAGNVRSGIRAALPLTYRMDPGLAIPAGGPGAGVALTGGWLAWDATLDRAPRGSVEPPVARTPWTGRIRAAVGYGWRAWTLTYGFTFSTGEYRTQRAPHGWGSLTLGWRAPG